MSSKKEDKAQDVVDKIKAATLNAAKGLSRAQAERAAAAAARNVNAYGQKEEGPSRWQERKEAKRQMYQQSTEKAATLGERKDLKSSMSSLGGGGGSSQCQKCFQTGHWTYQCKNERVYISRPSRTQQLKNPKLKMKFSVSYDEPDIPKKGRGEKPRKKSKRKHQSESDSGSDSEAGSDSSSVTRSDHSSEESSSSYSSSSDSEEERRLTRKKKPQRKRKHRRYSSTSESSDSDNRRRKMKKQRQRRHGRYSSTSESSDSESASSSDSDDRSRKRSRRR